MLLTWAALTLNLMGVSALYFRWRGKGPLLLTPLAWLLQALAIVCWSSVYGAEFGTVYGLAGIAMFAWLTVLSRSPDLAGSAKWQVKPDLGWHFSIPAFLKSLPKQVYLFLLVVPLSGICATFATVAITGLFPFELVNLLAFNAYVIPIVWGVFAYWAGAQENLVKPLLVFVLITAISALKLFVL